MTNSFTTTTPKPQPSQFVGDEWICECGNQPHRAGFDPCLADGATVEATAEQWTDGDLYRCMDCGLIIQLDSMAEEGWIVGLAQDASPDERSVAAWKKALASMEAELLHSGPLAFAQMEWEEEPLATLRKAIEAATGLAEITQEAEAAFWTAVSRRFPQATSGDLSPMHTLNLRNAARAAIAEWIANNVEGAI